jgi:hypothetical protein
MIEYTKKDATFSPCRLYRYELIRHWGEGARVCAFIMLNPSTATALEDDPTIRKCVKFAKSWGFDGLIVGNLYAFRATDPAELKRAGYLVGHNNDMQLADIAKRADRLICAWGANAEEDWANTMVEMLAENASCHIEALALNKNGSPRHPLYVADDTQPITLVEFDYGDEG